LAPFARVEKKTYWPAADEWLVITDVAMGTAMALILATNSFRYRAAIPIIMAAGLLLSTLKHKS